MAFEPRSVVLTFKYLEPWQRGLPLDYAGGSRNIPFAVRWRGPWALIDNPLKDSAVVKFGRFVVELQGPIGTIQFGRPLHLQAIDLARPINRGCPALPARQLGGDASTVAALPPVVLRGKRGGEEVFTEVIPLWELSTYVNGVAFAALTSAELVDSVSFLTSECVLVGAIQVTFGGTSARSVREIAIADVNADRAQAEAELAGDANAMLDEEGSFAGDYGDAGAGDYGDAADFADDPYATDDPYDESGPLPGSGPGANG